MTTHFSCSDLDTLQTETMSLTNTDVDRTTYLSMANQIKDMFGTDSSVIFRDTVKGLDGRFWIEPDDFAYMWKRILKVSERN